MKVLLTGASSGIGKEMAKILNKKGYDLVLVARDEEKLKDVKNELEKEKSKNNIEIISMDLSKEENCIELCKRVRNVDILINNAGFGDCGNFTKTDLEKEIKMIKTNIVAYHILMKEYLKEMKEKNSGKILNVASIAGFMPGPLMATYYASKAYVIRLTQGIQKELKFQKSNVKVSVLCPGPVKTNFQKVADVKFNSPEAESSVVARKAVAKMLKGRKIIFTSWYISLVRVFAKILPDSFMAFCCYFVQKRKI